MLARGVLARLAADAPTTSTHDLSRAAHLVTRRLFSRNGLFATSAATRSRAYKAALLQYRRSYATTTTKPTPKVVKDVKKVVAKKPVAKKPAAKKAVPKKKKVVPKKKKAVKPKPKPKPKRVKKVLTAEEKAQLKNKLKIKELKERALSPPAALGQTTAWHIVSAEHLKQKQDGSARDIMLAAAAQYKNLTPAEREHYNHLANEHTATKRAEYRAWIESYTPEQIRQANSARVSLTRILNSSPGGKRYAKLQDDRLLKAPASAFMRFSKERRESGDLKGLPVVESAPLIGAEWKALSASEKQKYHDEYVAENAIYQKEFEKLYGHALPSAKR